MTIGDVLKGNTNNYTVIKELAAGDRPNANLYLCGDEHGKLFVAKHFYNQSPRPNVSYSKKNHYGRRRDGSNLVFDEIRRKNGVCEERYRQNNVFCNCSR